MPKAKTLTWQDFCDYWNSVRELDVAACLRLYVQRWLPVLLPVIETDRFGMQKESHPSDLKIVASDGLLSEELILQLGGVGDYTFRLNDTRRPWEQATIAQSQLETKRLWDTCPPVFDLKRLDYEDKKNQVYIKFARSRGILPREDEREKDETDMANAAVLETVMDQAHKDRQRADQIMQAELERTRRENDELKKKNAEPTAEAKPAAPASDLLNVVTSVATLAKSLQAPKDDSLSEYLKLQAEREKTEREREKEERQTARESAAAERKRADDLQGQILADLKEANKAPAVVAVANTPRTDTDVLEEMVKKQALLKQLTGRGGPAEESQAEKPSSIDKWIDAAPVIGPIVQSVIGGIFQTIHFGLQTWQTISYNNALGKNGEPKPPTTMQTAPDPGKPIQPQGPQPTAEQQAQQQQWAAITDGVVKLAPYIARFLDKGKSGAELAEFVIENADEQRTTYDRIRNLAISLKQLGVQIPKGEGVEEFIHACRFVFQRIPALWSKVENLPTMPQFLNDFYNYDELLAQAQEEDQK